MISVVSVYNNRAILEECLLTSLIHQNTDYQLITLDNTKNQFKSASEALNHGGSLANGDYILFIHQDIVLESESWLRDLEQSLNELDNLGVAGVAGRSADVWDVITNITHGIPPDRASRYHVTAPMKVQTIDECAFVVSKSVFDRLKFDERTCYHWHLYSVAYCLSANRLGYSVYVLPLGLYHKSEGASMSKDYFLVLEKVIQKHNGEYDKIYTAMGNWATQYPMTILKSYFAYTLIRTIIKSYLGKLAGKNTIGTRPYVQIIKGMYK
jgi:hypothetical protein